MILPNMFVEKYNIVSSYCFFIFRNAFAVSIQRLKIVWNVQLDNSCTCEYDLYSVRIDFDSVCISDHCFLINKCVRGGVRGGVRGYARERECDSVSMWVSVCECI